MPNPPHKETEWKDAAGRRVMWRYAPDDEGTRLVELYVPAYDGNPERVIADIERELGLDV